MAQNVQFETDEITTSRKNKASSGFAQALITSNLAKNEKEANMILVITALLLFIGSALLISLTQQEEVPAVAQPDPDSLIVQ